MLVSNWDWNPYSRSKPVRKGHWDEPCVWQDPYEWEDFKDRGFGGTELSQLRREVEIGTHLLGLSELERDILRSELVAIFLEL